MLMTGLLDPAHWLDTAWPHARTVITIILIVTLILVIIILHTLIRTVCCSKSKKVILRQKKDPLTVSAFVLEEISKNNALP